MLSRACLVVCFVAGLSVAAPAPFARTKREALSLGWSKPVDGLRARLVSKQTRYKVGATIELTLEIQNVGGSTLAIEQPHPFYRVVRPSEHIAGWSISAESENEGLRQHLEELRDLLVLERKELRAGETLRIVLRLVPREEEAEMKKLVEAEDDKPRVVELDFPRAKRHGAYDLRVAYRTLSGQKKANRNGLSTWDGNGLVSPPVRIELMK